jgi:hypothetical protein
MKKPSRNSDYSYPKIFGAPISIYSVSNAGLATFKFGAAIIVPNFTNLVQPSNHRLLL